MIRRSINSRCQLFLILVPTLLALYMLFSVEYIPEPADAERGAANQVQELPRPTTPTHAVPPVPKLRMAMILSGQTRVFPFDWHYNQLLNNLIGPFRSKPEQFDLSLFFWLSLGNQAFSRSLNRTTDLPISNLQPAIAALKPTRVVIHNDSADPPKSPNAGGPHEWKVRDSAYSVSVKNDMIADALQAYERETKKKLDIILLTRVDGYWPNPITTDLPPVETILGRIVNNDCGYGGMDHFYFGRRDQMITLMKLWSNCTTHLFDETLRDPMCRPGCFGLECVQWNWLRLNNIHYENRLANYAAGTPHKWANNMVDIPYVID